MKKFNKKEVQYRLLAFPLEDLELDPKWLQVIKEASGECENPRRDGTPCYWCDNCYKKWQAERRNNIIEHDQAINAMMALYEETGRE